MCGGILQNDLVVRIQPEDYESALEQPYGRPMDFTGRPLKGFVYVGPDECRTEKELLDG
jgi:hypothetical protein